MKALGFAVSPLAGAIGLLSKKDKPKPQYQPPKGYPDLTRGAGIDSTLKTPRMGGAADLAAGQTLGGY